MAQIVRYKKHTTISAIADYLCEEFRFSLSVRDSESGGHEKPDTEVEEFVIKVKLPIELVGEYYLSGNQTAVEKIAFKRAKLEVAKAVELREIKQYSDIFVRADDFQLYTLELAELELPDNAEFALEVTGFKITRAYWHMQLHPDDPDFKKELLLLKEKQVIGLGSLKNKEQLNQFKDEMNIGDVVLIRSGAKALALVEVTGDFFVADVVDNTLDWFEFRRQVKILATKDLSPSDFPYSRGTLKKAVNPVTPTYQYIDTWYWRVAKIRLEPGSNKILSLQIENYKMFQNFSIEFCDANGQPCPLIVLAGINGSGKTSLLEYISQFQMITNAPKKNRIVTQNGSFSALTNEPNARDWQKNVIYLHADSGKLPVLKERILTYIDELILERDYRASEAYAEFGNTINEIFEAMSLKSRFCKINKNKEIIFKNLNEREFGFDELSSGEKNLLAKVLFLYLSKFKNKVILIDEPELSLHPSWQNQLISIYEAFASNNNNQIILATHSPMIIAGTRKEYLRLLTLSEGKAVAVTPASESYGMRFEQILFEIMGLAHDRTPRVKDQFDRLKELICKGMQKTKEFKGILASLEQELEKNDPDISLLKLEIAYRNHAENQ